MALKIYRSDFPLRCRHGYEFLKILDRCFSFSCTLNRKDDSKKDLEAVSNETDLLFYPSTKQNKQQSKSSRTRSKRYAYNLDELIAWKNETSKLLGPPRKPLKSGKLKKTRKTDDAFAATLETLSGISQSVSEPFRNVDDVKSQSNKIKKEKTSSPRPALCDFVPDLDDHHCTGLNPVNEPLFNDHHDTHAIGVDSDTYKSTSKLKKEKRISNSDTELLIPKIQPIPQASQFVNRSQSVDTVVGANASNKISSSQPPKSLKSYSSDTHKSFLSDAIEPPLSFNFISEFPFVPSQEHSTEAVIAADSFKLDVEKLSLRFLPSVKSILNKTMSDTNRFFLNRWRQNMIKELGEEGFRLHQNATINRGINLHANIMDFLSGKPVADIQIMPDNEGHWISLQGALGQLGEVAGLELMVTHPRLMYRGVFDCVAQYKDMLCLIDWKTSKKPKPLLKNTYDDPLQIAAYMGAVNADPKYLTQFGQTNHGVIVVGYEDGSPAHVHMLDRKLCEDYWRDWTERLYTFYQLAYTEKFGGQTTATA